MQQQLMLTSNTSSYTAQDKSTQEEVEDGFIHGRLGDRSAKCVHFHLRLHEACAMDVF